jgi:hypothetical protein
VQGALFNFGVLGRDDKREMEKIPRGLKYSGEGGEQNRVKAAKKKKKKRKLNSDIKRVE